MPGVRSFLRPSAKLVYFPMQKVETELIASIHAALIDCALPGDTLETQNRLLASASGGGKKVSKDE